MTLTVNGRAVSFAGEATVVDVVTALTSDPRGVAVALNGEVVPRAVWAVTVPRDGDRVEVLTAVQGG